MDNLPGYPDGLTEGSEGTYWLSLVTLNSPALEAFLKSRFVAALVLSPSEWQQYPATALAHCWMLQKQA